MDLPISFVDFLKLIGSPLFVGVVLSLLLTKWEWFANLKLTTKFWAVGAVSLLLPILSRVLLTYLPLGAVAFIGEWYPTVLVGMGIWMSSQVWNKLFGTNGAVTLSAKRSPDYVEGKK